NSSRRLEKNPSDEIIVCPICQEKLSANVIAAHASACNLYLCPVAWDNNCQWRGSVSQSVDHIAKGHRSVNRVTGPNAVIVLKSWRKASPLYWSSLQTCLGYNFLVEIKKIERFDKYPNFYGVVRLFGQQEDADRFEYKMTMKTRGKMARTSSYSTTVRALHENSVIHKDDAFVFDSSQAEIFSYEGNLEVEVSISVMKM
ncbi:uncharacterized protein LOC117645138, partial [Thrips palmi]|uniref:E3 ubiquitin-protein ligase n=1 Tax=Thrips palmi TaxID=161013 RepID=A0A6P8YM38_THRPL